MSIGELVRQFREEKRFSRKQLGLLVEQTSEQLKNIESGRTMPKADVLQRLADVLELPAAKVAKALRGTQ
jgi:transcriptional regulator with XRE-family HTH domain